MKLYLLGKIRISCKKTILKYVFMLSLDGSEHHIITGRGYAHRFNGVYKLLGV